MRRIVLDNEAVEALLQPGHPKKRTVQAHLDAQAGRRQRGRESSAMVPVAVRVEAGWDRSSPMVDAINRLLIGDDALDTDSANHAAAIQAAEMVGVADAHVGAAIRQIDPDTEVVVLTSDPDDIRRACGGRAARVVRV